MVQIANLAQLGNRTALKLEDKIIAEVNDILLYLLQIREIKAEHIEKTIHKIVLLRARGIHDVQPLAKIRLDNRAIE